jgi:protein SCO1
MSDISRRKLFAGLASQSTFEPPDSGREVMRKRYFPNVPLVTHAGNRIRFYDDLLKGKIVVINLMYADCESLCPMITTNLLRAQKILANRVNAEVFFYSLTIKPEDDTPEKLDAYARMHLVGKNWLFLTGKPADLELLRQKLGYADADPEKDRKDKALHSGMVRYGNEPLSQWSSIQGSADPEWIAEEITYVIPAARYVGTPM